MRRVSIYLRLHRGIPANVPLNSGRSARSHVAGIAGMSVRRDAEGGRRMNNKSKKKEQFFCFVLFFPRSALGRTQRKHKDKSASLEASPSWRRSLLSATGDSVRSRWQHSGPCLLSHCTLSNGPEVLNNVFPSLPPTALC